MTATPATMLHRLLNSFRGRRHQAYQISRWRRVKHSDFNTEERLAIRQSCNCLFVVTEEVVDLLYPQEAGAFFSVIHKCVECLVVWIGFELDGPSDDHVNLFCRQLKDYINTRFPDAAICTTAIMDLAKLVTDALQREHAHVPGYGEAVAQVSQPGWTDDQVRQLLLMQLELSKALSVAHEWSDTDDSSISSGDSNDIMVPRRVTEIVRADRGDRLRIVNV